MSQRIEKGCVNEQLFLRPQQYYKQVRQAFGAVLDSLGMDENKKILVPAYIGWSAREGSGVFDPIRERGIQPVFYHMNRNLEIDKDDCIAKIVDSGAKVLLVIHYFGFVDSAAKEIISVAKEKGMVVIEDAAHGLYTDKIGGACGRDGDYTLYSLHKMLPLSDGGILVSNGKPLPEINATVSYDIEGYDFKAISNIRVRNYRVIADALNKTAIKGVTLLRSELEDGIVPQTLPVVINGSDRDLIYAKMNDLGWGIVSLYHTMIEELKTSDFEDELWLSKHITNLPVHQDLDISLINEMVNDFARVVKECTIR